MTERIAAETDRKHGKVTRVLSDYGFISGDDISEQDLYFKMSWFRDSPPLVEGDSVSFEIKSYGTNRQAHQIQRPSRDGGVTVSSVAALTRVSISDRLLEWAYFGYLPNVLGELQGLALQERWEFKDAAPNPERPLPVLFGYLFYTFQRLVLERKVSISTNKSFAAFNTGLVDRRYETIYALFSPNNDPRAKWQLNGFCIAGEGAVGQNLVRHFNPLPPAAHYFDTPVDLLYDTRAGKPELDWSHIILDNISRYPREFIEDHCPPGFALENAPHLHLDQGRSYFEKLSIAIEGDSRTYRRIMNRMKDAVDLSIKRVCWNFKTAIPQYYPRVRKLQLLLPICLVSDELVDLALAVEKTNSGSYLGHTVLPLDWAYRNARLICRPDSDWLAPEEIIEQANEDQDA